MRTRTIPAVALSVLMALPSLADDVRSQLQATVHARSESVLLDESTSAELTKAQANYSSRYGAEVRPSATDNEGEIAIRINLPDRWTKAKLREQLFFTAQAEALRVEALEWQELLSVYRDFCRYRMLHKQLALYETELDELKPYLKQADQAVEQHQFAAADRAKLYADYLDLLNDREKVVLALIDVQRPLHQALGTSAELRLFAEAAVITWPTPLDVDNLLQQALDERADYRRMDMELKGLKSAEKIARSKDGLRLKYIQPAYSADYDGEESEWGISAALVMPWGPKNPDIAMVQQQQKLAVSRIAMRRQASEEKIRTLVKATEDYSKLIAWRKRSVQPLLDQLQTDLQQIDSGHLDQMRDVMLIRKRILDSALQTSRAACERERITVDLAEELGTLNEWTDTEMSGEE